MRETADAQAWWNHCVVCRQAPRAFSAAAAGARLCELCEQRLRRLRRTRDAREAAACATSLYHYRQETRALLLRAKVQGDHRALDLLVALLTSAAPARRAAAWADVLMPCPSSLWGRLRGRLDVAHHLARQLGRDTQRPVLPAAPHLYWRVRKRARLQQRRPRQLKAAPIGRLWRSAVDRWRQELATLDERTAGSRRERRPLRLLLIDDVITTGHTLRTVIQSCPEAAHIRVLTLAGRGAAVLPDVGASAGPLLANSLVLREFS